jgi:membrane protein DedA with SNARE-associated domain
MIEWITGMLDSAGYLAVILLMLLENVFPPIPCEVILPLAGLTAAKGKLTFIGVALAGTLGSVLGSVPLYYLGKWFGLERLKQWADKHGRWLTITGKDLDKNHEWFERHGNKAVFLGRLVPGIRSLISIPAGIHGMNLGKFLLYTTLSAAIGASLLTLTGYVLEENYNRIEKYLKPASYVFPVGLLLLYVARVITYKPQSAPS